VAYYKVNVSISLFFPLPINYCLKRLCSLFIAIFIIQDSTEGTGPHASAYKNIHNVRDIIQYALNLVLDGTVEKENIFYKCKQIGAYADDIFLVKEINKS
jgi:hypothetical protein